MDLIVIVAGVAGVIQLIILIVFYKYIASGDKLKAKEVLFDEISKSKEFQLIVQGVNEKYASDLSNQLNEKFKKELGVLNMNQVEFLNMC